MPRYPKYDVQGVTHSGQSVWFRVSSMAKALNYYHRLAYGRIIVSGRTITGPVNRDAELDSAMETIRLSGKIRER